MADDRYEWLDGAAAEKLLRGEPVEPVVPAGRRHPQDDLRTPLRAVRGPAADGDPADAHARDGYGPGGRGPDGRAPDGRAARVREEAARLADALDSLVPAMPAAGSGELPGEAAALAAFRAVHAVAAPRPAPVDDDLLTVRLGVLPESAHAAPLPGRIRRPLRLGLAAAIAAVAIGGVAAAAGTGLLPGPRVVAGPGPSVSVTLDPAPRPSGSPGYEEPGTGEPAEPLRVTEGPIGGADTASPGTGSGSPSPGEDGGAKEKDRDRDRNAGGTDGTAGGTESATKLAGWCRELRAGRLDGERKSLLERAARGTRVEKFCDRLLGGGAGDTGSGSGGSSGSGSGGGDGGRDGGKDPGDEILQKPPGGTTPGEGTLPTLGFGRPAA
ncbi:hypothetical protein [Streptomyces sp. NBC_00239]|uniref:hypothetical protein n=1 Tax=Streptomyces sp. NBC_00239 TaxID=2903640 RepID=UPI002E27BEBD|nr:hypothetical protein [Streptomyces sp. NBC_00239]